jgi:serine protease Do
VSEQLRVNGRVIRGRIAVSIDQVTKDVAEAIGLGKPMGALVRSVESGGPAEKAGIEAGDIITRFDGKTIEKSGDLPRIVGSVRPGTRVGVQVFRRGSYRDFSVTVAEVEPERAARTVDREPRPKASVDSIGLVVADLTEVQKRELKIKNGVRVESVEGAAAKAGLREGDVILSLDNAEVTSAKQFESAAAKLDKSRSVTLLVKRGEAANFIVIKPGR